MAGKENIERKFCWKRFWLSMINPLSMAVYWCFWFHLYSLFQYGQPGRNGTILLVSVFWLIFFCFRAITKAWSSGRKTGMEEMEKFQQKYLLSAIMCCGAVAVYYGNLILTTVWK